MERKFTIKQARAMTGLNQAEMAEKLGVSENTFINYEQYKTYMRMDTGYKFSELTGIHIDDIIFFKKELQIECS